MIIKEIAKRLARLLLGDYGFYRVYADAASAPAVSVAGLAIVALDAAVLSGPDPWVRDQAWYGGEGSHVFACMEGEQVLGLCVYWHGARYLKRNFWPLAAGEAKLVQVIVRPEHRGRSIATALIAESARQMRAGGFGRLYARIWHSNEPSLRAFRRAGWHCIGSALEFNPLRLARPWRLRMRRRSG